MFFLVYVFCFVHFFVHVDFLLVKKTKKGGSFYIVWRRLEKKVYIKAVGLHKNVM